MPTSLIQTNLKYEDLRLLRELLIEELKSQVTYLTVEHLKLVEMRLTNTLLSGMTVAKVKTEVDKLKVKDK